MNNERDSTLEGKDTRAQRISVFLLVFLLHGLLIAVLMRERKLVLFSKHSSESLLVYFLPRESSLGRDALKTESPSQVVRKNSVLQRRRPSANAPNASITQQIEAATPTPQIDWQKELLLAVRDRVANEESENTYRDLSKSMSPSQVDWLKQHHMAPAAAGLAWKTPRVEVTKDGMLSRFTSTWTKCLS